MALGNWIVEVELEGEIPARVTEADYDRMHEWVAGVTVQPAPNGRTRVTVLRASPDAAEMRQVAERVGRLLSIKPGGASKVTCIQVIRMREEDPMPALEIVPAHGPAQDPSRHCPDCSPVVEP